MFFFPTCVRTDSPSRVVVETSSGPLTLELFHRQAPETVTRFLARAGLSPAPSGLEVAPYAGSQVCEVRAHGYLVFGCLPFELGPVRPRAPGIEPPTKDEIDGRALGLGRRRIEDPKERDWLWQQEIFPRYGRLVEQQRPVPPRMKNLVDAVVRQGTSQTVLLQGRSRLWFLQAMGFKYQRGGSPFPFERGAVATVNLWPGEADERFMIALTSIPERDGRGTVFGRLVGGYETLEALERVPVDKAHRPWEKIVILKVTSQDPNP